MSTFDALESSVESSRPIELYRITLGSEVFRYTSAEDEITVGAETFDPESIARGVVKLGADAENRILVLTVPGGNPFAAKYIQIPPGQKAVVEVIRYQRNEVPAFNTAVLLFKGTVTSTKFPDDGNVAEISVQSVESSMNANVPRFTYMGMCNHFLYDAGCTVDPSGFNHVGNVSAVNGNMVTVDGAGASGFDFTGGHCRPVSFLDFRMVVAQSGDDLTLLLPFPVNMVGQNLQVFAGCDHLLTGDCALVFDNVINFGGFAYVPTRNVFQMGIPRG